MKVIVVGLGSMGKRRIRLIKQYDSNIEIVGIDSSFFRTSEVKKQYCITVGNDLNSFLKSERFDCAFIATPPLTHGKIIKQCLESDLHIFTELNLVDDYYEENLALAKHKNKILFLSSTFQYRDEIIFLKNVLQEKETEKSLNYSYHVGQYLPDWHPWEKIEDFFVSETRTNGCRELFALELPWIVSIFGNIKKIHVVKSNISSLPIKYPDNYLLIVEHLNGNKGLLAVDIVTRKAVRNLEIFGEHIYVKWDGTPNGLFLYDIEGKKDRKITLYNMVDHADGYESFIIENAYLNEIYNFFQCIIKEKQPFYSLEKDKEILTLIDQIEEK